MSFIGPALVAGLVLLAPSIVRGEAPSISRPAPRKGTLSAGALRKKIVQRYIVGEIGRSATEYEPAADRGTGGWGHHLGVLTQRAATADPTGGALGELVLPLMDRSMGSARGNGAEHLGALAYRWGKQDTTGKALEESILPRVRSALESGSAAVQEGAASSLGLLGRALLDNPATDARFESHWLPLYEITARAGGGLAWSGAKSLPEVMRGLATSVSRTGLTAKQAGRARKIASLIGASWGSDMLLGPLGGTLLKIDPSGALLDELWLPLARKATIGIRPDVGFGALLGGPLSEEPAAVLKPRLASLHGGDEAKVAASLASIRADSVANTPEADPPASKVPLAVQAATLFSPGASPVAALNGWRPAYQKALKSNLAYERDQAVAASFEAIRVLDPAWRSHTPVELWGELRQRIARAPKRWSRDALRLGIALLHEGLPAAPSDATPRWSAVTDIFETVSRLPAEARDVSLLRELSSASVAALQRGGELDDAAVAKLYARRFPGEKLPPKRNHPKDLLAFMLLDDHLRMHGLPASFGARLRQKKHGPPYRETLSLVARLGEGDELLHDAIAAYEAWGADVVGAKRQQQYWGSVEKILFGVAGNTDGLHRLDLWNDIVALVQSHRTSDADVQAAGGKDKLMQQRAHALSVLPAKGAAGLLGMASSSASWQPTARELRGVLYLALIRGQSAMPGDHHEEITGSLDAYLKIRLSGGEQPTAQAAFDRSIGAVREVQASLAALGDKADPATNKVKGPAAQTVHVSDGAQGRDLVISRELDPIEIIHLGYRMGGSCKSIEGADSTHVNGGTHIALYGGFLDPHRTIVYVRDPKRPDQPLARVIADYDPATRVLTFDHFYTNSGIDLRPALREYGAGWAKMLGAQLAVVDRGLGSAAGG